MKRFFLTIVAAMAVCIALPSCEGKNDPEDDGNVLAGTKWTGSGNFMDAFAESDGKGGVDIIRRMCEDEITLNFSSQSMGTYYKNQKVLESGLTSKITIMFNYEINGKEVSIGLAGGAGPEDCLRTATIVDDNNLTLVESDGSKVKMKRVK